MSDDFLRTNYTYDPMTGTLFRNGRKYGHGNRSSRYVVVTAPWADAHKPVVAHRLCWFLYYGRWPHGIVHHINDNPRDNRIVNLMDVTRREHLKLHAAIHNRYLALMRGQYATTL